MSATISDHPATLQRLVLPLYYIQTQITMSPTFFSCIICGDVVHRGDRNSTVSWLAEFRAGKCLPCISAVLRSQGADSRHQTEVFSGPPDLREPKVSGVGLNHDPDDIFYVVPSSYDARWDDDGYQFPATDGLPMMRQYPSNGRHGFIFHAVCYSLLQEFFHPRRVPVARLLEICKSCPFQYLGLSWGHDYGGIVHLMNQHPWEDQDVDNVEQPELHQHRRADPWNIPELKELLQVTKLDMPKKQRVNSTKLTLIDDILSNCFMRLPLEILEYIVTYLPTDDVVILARTSKWLAMNIPSALGPLFWASRFQPPFELDFVFEARKDRGRIDWRSLYFGVVKAIHRSPGLQNRKRIWGLIRSPLSELICMHWNGSLALCPLEQNKDELRWKEVHGNLQPLEHVPGTARFKAGCKRFHIQRTSIPILLRQVVVSTILIGNATYVTCVRFIPNEGPGVYLGYTAEGKISSSNTADQFMDTTGILGFILAIGSRGIQALQFISYTGQLSQWFGRPEGLPQTRRLATSKSITALEAGFDVRATSFHIITNSLITCARDSKWLAWRLQRHFVLMSKVQ
jgi:hypothetical protein